MSNAFEVDELLAFAQELLLASGMAAEPAGDVARILVEGDLLGHDTHGLQLLAGYAGAVADGTMLGDGKPEVMAERSSVLTWSSQITGTPMPSGSGPISIPSGTCQPR